MTRSQKRDLYRILIAAALLIAASLLPLTGWARLAAYLAPYLVIGYAVLWKAARNIAHGQIFDENFLMALATVGALIIGEYPEAVFVMLFYEVGELFEHVAVGKSRKSIAALMDIRQHCEEDLATFWDQYKRLLNPHRYKVDLSDSLWMLKNSMIQQLRRG